MKIALPAAPLCKWYILEKNTLFQIFSRIYAGIFVRNNTCAVLPNDIYDAKIPFSSCNVIFSRKNRRFVPLPVFYSQAAVGRQRLVRSPFFIPESIFYTQSAMLSPRIIPQSVFYAQCVVRTQSELYP